MLVMENRPDQLVLKETQTKKSIKNTYSFREIQK